jgi:RNA polymerase sigma factor (TIGR02999 family)
VIDIASPGQITTLLTFVKEGDQGAREEVCRLIYARLRQVAHHLMPNCAGHTLQPTVLVHEAMLRLMNCGTLEKLPNRRCLFSVAIQAMKQVLIEHHRARATLKRGGAAQRVPLDTVLDIVECEAGADIESLCAALERLEKQNARQHEIIQLRFFGGLTVRETADSMDVSTGTVVREWRLARAKLFAFLQED